MSRESKGMQVTDTALAAERVYFSLAQVAQHLPTPTLPVTDVALEAYLTALYQLGRLRHTPNISPQNVQFLHTLLQQHQPLRILELGCANGYSTLRLWQASRSWNASITTLEIAQPAAQEAQHHFDTVGAPIHLHCADALKQLPEWQATEAPFDFIFIDAQKSLTLDLYRAARPLAAPHALIVVDDVVKFKHKMANFYAALAQENTAYTIHALPDDDDGVMLIPT